MIKLIRFEIRGLGQTLLLSLLYTLPEKRDRKHMLEHFSCIISFSSGLFRIYLKSN